MKDRLSYPLVSIQIAARDRLDHLQESVSSALDQSWEHLEVLIIDDGSRDPTRTWIERSASRHDRIRIIRQPNCGVASARQAGLESTDADLVCVLDSDDLLAEHAVERIVECFGADPRLDLVYTNNLQFRADGTHTLSRYPNYSSNESMIRGTFLRPIVPFKHSGTTYRRTVALALGGYNTDLSIKVDVDLFLRFLTLNRRLRLLDEPVVKFRLHGSLMSHARRLAGVQTWMQLIDRYQTDRSLWTRAYYKGVRSSVEVAKGFYALLALR